MVLDYNNKVTYLFLVPMNEDIFLYEHFPPHVSLVEYLQLVEVIAHLDKAENYASNNTEKDKHNHHA